MAGMQISCTIGVRCPQCKTPWALSISGKEDIPPKYEKLCRECELRGKGPLTDLLTSLPSLRELRKMKQDFEGDK